MILTQKLQLGVWDTDGQTDLETIDFIHGFLGKPNTKVQTVVINRPIGDEGENKEHPV